MKAIYRILRYLKGTLRRGLFFKRIEKISVEAFTNVN